MLEVLHINHVQIDTLLLLSTLSNLIDFWSALTAIGMGLGSVSNQQCRYQ